MKMSIKLPVIRTNTEPKTQFTVTLDDDEASWISWDGSIVNELSNSTFKKVDEEDYEFILIQNFAKALLFLLNLQV